jgi:hypothetical protein
MEAVTDEDLEYDYDEGDDVSETTMMLVNERDFDSMYLFFYAFVCPSILEEMPCPSLHV